MERTEWKGVGSNLVGTSPTSTFLLSRTFVLVTSFAFGLYFFGFATKGSFDPGAIGTYWPGHFFSAQADALLNGRLWVERSYLPWECFFEDGKCFGYFGLTPSIARIPLVVMLGVEQSEMTALFLAIAAGVAIWAALDLCRRVLLREVSVGDRWAAGFMAMAAIVLGPGSVLMLNSDAYVYQEAIMWATAGMIVGVNLFWRWWVERKDRQFAGAMIALVLAAGSRPTAALVGGVLAGGMVLVRYRRGRLGWRPLAAGALLTTLPLLAVVGVWAAKFGAIMPPWDGYEGRNFEFIQYNMSQNGGDLGNSIGFIPTAGIAYIRPDTLRIDGEWPFFTYRFGRPYGEPTLERIAYVPPANIDSINVEPTVSISNVAPIPLIATVIGAIAIVRRRRQRFELLLLASLTTPIIIMTTATTVGTRYLGDFYPLLAAGTAFAATLIPRIRRSSWNTRALVTLFVVTLSLLSIPVVAALAAQYNWTYRFGLQ